MLGGLLPPSFDTATSRVGVWWVGMRTQVALASSWRSVKWRQILQLRHEEYREIFVFRRAARVLG